jgi:hypothetical protein
VLLSASDVALFGAVGLIVDLRQWHRVLLQLAQRRSSCHALPRARLRRRQPRGPVPGGFPPLGPHPFLTPFPRSGPSHRTPAVFWRPELMAEPLSSSPRTGLGVHSRSSVRLRGNHKRGVSDGSWPNAIKPLLTRPDPGLGEGTAATGRRNITRSEGTTTPNARCPSSPSEAPEVSRTT